MSKVIVYHAYAKDTYPVTAATKTTGWLPGQGFAYDSTGDYVAVAVVDNVMMIAIDDDDELSAPPTGSLVTGVYGSGTKILIDHSEEVTAGSSTRAYDSEVESASLNANLYISTTGKWQTTATGSVRGKLWRIPKAANNYQLGVVLRF